MDRSAAPDFELTTLDGESIRLSTHRGGDVVLLDFWATYCDPCLLAMPRLETLYQKHKSVGFAVWGISIDGPESIARVRGEVRRLGVSFPILLDQETRTVELYNPKSSAPFSVLIGRDGSIAKKTEGYSTSHGDQLERDVAAALEFSP